MPAGDWLAAQSAGQVGRIDAHCEGTIDGEALRGLATGAQLEDGHFRRGGSGFRIQCDATPNPSVWLAGELLDGGWGDRGEEVDEVAIGVAEQQ